MLYRCVQRDTLGHVFGKRDVVLEADNLMEAVSKFYARHGEMPTAVVEMHDGVDADSIVQDLNAEIQKLAAELGRQAEVNEGRRIQVKSLERKVSRWKEQAQAYKTAYQHMLVYMEKHAMNVQSNLDARKREMIPLDRKWDETEKEEELEEEERKKKEVARPQGERAFFTLKGNVTGISGGRATYSEGRE